MPPPETRYAVREDGVSIAYQVLGSGPLDLVMVPGFISHLDFQWTDPGFARYLRRLASFSRLIMFDKVGTGCSDPIAHLPTLDERAADIATVMDAAGSEQAALLAISEGGPASLVLAATRPERVRALVLYGTFAAGVSRSDAAEREALGLTPERLAAMQRTWEDILAHWGQGRLAALVAPSLDGEVARRFYALFERAAASPRMARALMDVVWEIDARDVLPLVRQPALVLHRTGDRVVPFAGGRMMAAALGARLVELSGVDHAFWLGDFDAIVDEIEGFLTGVRRHSAPERALAAVLFTDIAGSTELAARMGDREWRALLERHDAMLETGVGEHGGRVVKHIGDGMLAAFDGPARAVRCARELLRSAEGLGVRLRAGVHAGECEFVGDDLGGMAVHIGARVSAAAAPGEVLVSSTVRDLVVGSELVFADRGERELKGVPGSWRLFALADAAAPEPLDAPGALLGAADRATLRAIRRAPGAFRLGARVAARRRAASA